MDSKAVVLLSGGIDSSTCLAIASRNYHFEKIYTLSFDYGQRNVHELKAAKRVSAFFERTEHHVIQFDLRIAGNSALTDDTIIHFCTLALDEIGDNIIKTGDYIHPGEGGDPDNPHHAAEHALFGTDDIHQNTTIPEEELLGPRLFNVPTDKERSPSVFTVDGVTYDVSEPFTQQMLRLEELGRIDIEKAKGDQVFKPESLSIPLPTEDGFPTQIDLHNFMNDVCSESGNLGFEPTK